MAFLGRKKQESPLKSGFSARLILGIFWNFLCAIIIKRLLIPRDPIKKIFGTQIRQKRWFSPKKMRASWKTGEDELPENLDLIDDGDHMAAGNN